jgi:hypothetical protein
VPASSKRHETTEVLLMSETFNAAVVARWGDDRVLVRVEDQTRELPIADSLRAAEVVPDPGSLISIELSASRSQWTISPLAPIAPAGLAPES